MRTRGLRLDTPVATTLIDKARARVAALGFLSLAAWVTAGCGHSPTEPRQSTAEQPNLVAGLVTLTPATPVCGQQFVVGFDVGNQGTVASASGTVRATDARSATGDAQASTTGAIPALQPGQTFHVNLPLTVSTWFSEAHTVTLVIDPDGGIAETSKTDNQRQATYTLARGGC